MLAAVVGLGVGEQHARALAASPGVRLRLLCDLERQRAERLRDALGQGEVVDRFEDVLLDPAVQLVSIASYDHVHARQVEAALRAGKHVFAEKPLARTNDELVRIVEALQARSELHLGCNLVLRAAPLYRWLRDLVLSGELGEVFAFDGDYLYGRLHKITDGWRRDVQDYSVMQGGGVHMVDLMMWITGQRPKSVTCIGNRIATRGTAFRYPDFCAATYAFESGLVGRVCANFGCVHRHQHAIRVFGTRATFLCDDAGARLCTTRDPASAPTRIELPPLAKKGALIPEFVGAIRAGTDRRAAAARELDLVAACLAADRALLTGTSVPIEYR